MSTKSKLNKEKSKNVPQRKTTTSDASRVIELISSLSEDEQMVVAKRVTSMTSMYSGPIPHYSDFKHYEEILPGAADRILKMAEKQAEHRQSLEKAAVLSGIDDSRRGQWFAFLIGLSISLAGVTLIFFDKNVSGFSLIIASIGGLAGLFIFGRNSEREERESKDKQN